MPRIIEVKYRGRWIDVSALTMNEDARGYLIVRFSPNDVQEFRPVEWRILED